MITLILAEDMKGPKIHCTVKARGLVMVRQKAENWEEAFKWARAIVADPPERPSVRTRWQEDGDDAAGAPGGS